MTRPDNGDARPRPLVYLIAGEPSGDRLGARLMAALKEQSGSGIAFRGIGGVHMGAEGLQSRVPIAELSVMAWPKCCPGCLRCCAGFANPPMIFWPRGRMLW